jgi:S1-C subfamily serine protease
VQFVDKDQLALGETAMAVFNSRYSGQRVTITNLENLSFNEENDFSTSIHPYDYLIADNLKQEYFGSALINNDGDVIGMNVSDSRVLPYAFFSDRLTQIISEQKIQRIDLSLEYSNLDKGALIMTSRDLSLQKDDIILKIDDQEIDKFHNLTALLQEYQPGDTAVFTVKRQGKEQEIEVVL